MKLTAQEEYGLRCLITVARRAPEPESEAISIRDIAEAEGLSLDYAAKLMRVLRQGQLVTSERGAQGGYRLARPAEEMMLSEVLRVLDTPLFSSEFCGAHAGQADHCVHSQGCAMRPVWSAIQGAVDAVCSRFSVRDLLAPVRQETPESDRAGSAGSAERQAETALTGGQS